MGPHTWTLLLCDFSHSCLLQLEARSLNGSLYMLCCCSPLVPEIKNILTEFRFVSEPAELKRFFFLNPFSDWLDLINIPQRLSVVVAVVQLQSTDGTELWEPMSTEILPVVDSALFLCGPYPPTYC